MNLRCRLGLHKKKFENTGDTFNSPVKVTCKRCGKHYGTLKPPVSDEEFNQIVHNS